MQLSENDCGIACIRNILAVYGYFPSIPDVIQFMKLQYGGISLLDIEAAFQHLGFNTLTAQFSIDDLTNIIHQSIILYLPQGHFMVLYDAKDEHYLIGDPAKGRFWITKTELKKKWLGNNEKGVALLAEPDHPNHEILKKKPSGLFQHFIDKSLEETQSFRTKIWLSIFLQWVCILGSIIVTTSMVDNNNQKYILTIILTAFLLLAGGCEIFTRKYSFLWVQLMKIKLDNRSAQLILSTVPNYFIGWLNEWQLKDWNGVYMFLNRKIITPIFIKRNLLYSITAFVLLVICLGGKSMPFLLIGILMALVIYFLPTINIRNGVDYFETTALSRQMFEKLLMNRNTIQEFSAKDYFLKKWESEEFSAFNDRSFFNNLILKERAFFLLVSFVSFSVGVLYLYYFIEFPCQIKWCAFFLWLFVCYFIINIYENRKFSISKLIEEKLNTFWEISQISKPKISHQEQKNNDVSGVQSILLDKFSPPNHISHFISYRDEEPYLFRDRIEKEVLQLERLEPIKYPRDIIMIDNQSPIFFDSILNNITFGKKIDIANIVHLVELEDELKSLPNGIHTVLNPTLSNIKLKRKILLARLLCHRERNINIVNFDNWDGLNNFLNGFYQWYASNKLESIWFFRVSHTNNLLKEVTHTIYVEEDEIIESGTWQQLMTIKGATFRWSKNNS